MTLQARDRRALTALSVSVVLSAVFYFWPAGTAAPAVVSSPDSVSNAEKRVTQLRDLAAAVPQKEAVLKNVSDDLAKREGGLIQADTAEQARAHLLEIVRRLCGAESIEVRSTELGAIAPFGDSYGTISAAVQIECRIEQLINLLASIATQPELIATSDLRVTAPNESKEKLIGARIVVSGVIPRKLVPNKKGPSGL